MNSIVKSAANLKHQIIFGKSTFFRRTVVTIFTVAMIPIVLLTITSYYNFAGEIQHAVIANQTNQLDQASQRLHFQLRAIEQSLVNWSYDVTYQRVADSTNLNQDYELVKTFFGNLALSRRSNPYISEVALYRKGDASIFTDNNGRVSLRSDQKQTLMALISQTNELGYVPAAHPLYDKQGPSIIVNLVCPLTGSSTPALLIVSINTSLANELLDQLKLSQSGVAFLVDRQEVVYQQKSNQVQEMAPLVRRLRSQVSTQAETTGNFLYKDTTGDFSVIYGSYDHSGWTYVAAVPLTSIFAPVERTTQILVAISGMTVLLLLVVSFFFSGRLYRPLRALTEKLRGSVTVNTPEVQDEVQFIGAEIEAIRHKQQELQTYFEVNRQVLQEGFLMQLANHHLDHYSELELQETIVRLGWNVELTNLAVLVVRLVDSSQAPKRLASLEQRLEAYSLVNNVIRLVPSPLEVLGLINFHDGSFSLILNSVTMSDSQNRELIQKLAELVFESLSGSLNVRMAVGVSRTFQSLNQLANAFSDASTAIRYRDVESSMEILFSADVLRSSENKAFYPIQLEAEILHALQVGDLEELPRKIAVMGEELLRSSSKEYSIQQGFLHLLGRILHELIQTGEDLNKLFGTRNLYGELTKLTEPKEIMDWFTTKVVGPCQTEIQNRQRQTSEKQIRQVTTYIEEFFNNDISLDICADELGIPPKKLSVLFAKVTGTNFVDYVTSFRLAKAKQYLKETDETIAEIAEKVGYQPSYFHKAFRKQEGITAGEYRTSYR